MFIGNVPLLMGASFLGLMGFIAGLLSAF